MKDSDAIDALIRECGGITPLEHARQRAADAMDAGLPFLRQIMRDLGGTPLEYSEGGETWHAMPPGEWSVAPMTCAVCGKEWVAAYPSEAPALECPECGHMNPAPEAEP